MHSGKTLSEIAQAQGVDLTKVQEAVKAVQVQATKDRIGQAVKDGSMTQDKADWLLVGLDKGYMDGGPGFGPFGGGHMMGGMGPGPWAGGPGARERPVHRRRRRQVHRSNTSSAMKRAPVAETEQVSLSDSISATGDAHTA